MSDPTTARKLVFDQQQLLTGLEREPFLFRHNLAAHALLQLPRLIGLAQTLPTASVEYNRADIPLNQEYLKTPANGMSTEETLRQIEQCSSWMVLKNVEQDAAYRDLLHAALDEMRPATERALPGMCVREGFIFVSSPGAVTPYHCDPEHNFLLQIRGSKQFAVFDRDDPLAISQPHMEAMAQGAHRNLPFDERMQARKQLFELQPGMGLHVPMYSPHWVRVGEAVSISFSITFRSHYSTRYDQVLRLNARLRRLGLNPAPARPQGAIALGKATAERLIAHLTPGRS